MNIIARVTVPRCASNRRREIIVSVIVALLVCGSAAAQFGPGIEVPPGLPSVMPAPAGGYPPTVAPTIAGPYLGRSTWSQSFPPNARFLILSNFNSDAVLDRATGLVWARQNLNDTLATDSSSRIQGAQYQGAKYECETLIVGARMGWRVPSPSELLTLLVYEAGPNTEQQPRLPAGHPFLLSNSPRGSNLYYYWTSDVTTSDNVYTNEQGTIIRLSFDLASGSMSYSPVDGTSRLGVLCVRGPKGGA